MTSVVLPNRPRHSANTTKDLPGSRAVERTSPLQHRDAAPASVLATDLDGTMTAGPDDARATIADAMSRSDAPELIYASELPFGAAESLRQSAGLPVPEVWVTDGGCRLSGGRYREMLTPLEMELAAAWPGTGAVWRRLQRVAAEVAPIRSRGIRRLDLRLRPGARHETVVPGIELALEGLDLDVCRGDDGTIAITPHGVGRGSTLLRVIEWIAADKTVVLGGSLLHDPPLLESRLPGFALPDAHPLLRQVVRERPNLYLARRTGAAGMVDGLRYFGLLGDDSGIN